MTLKTAAFTVPILPQTSPEAKQPPGLKLPLHSHQLRALHRCLVIEQDGSLGSDFGHRFDYQSRGGCLADAVGTGKTATSIGLVLAGLKDNEGDTLVVAPAHLIPQWKAECEKFASRDALEVIVGQDEYDRKCSILSYNKRRIVLIDVDTVLNQKKVWYDFGRIFRSAGGKQLTVKPERLELIRKGALFSVRSPKGPCSYAGWAYTGSLHLPQHPWRRIIFDEIQDLVAQGSDSQKCLLQLTRTATHVWLLSATPFPHGNKSVYANHELLGFNRLVLDVEVDSPLPSHHPFERIKRKIYIRSPRHVADEAVAAKKAVQRQTIDVQRLDLERRFYNLELEKLPKEASMFAETYNPLREMTVHPEASEELRAQMTGSQHNAVSSSVGAAASRAVAQARRRLQEIHNMNLQRSHKQIHDVVKSLALARKIKEHRAGPMTANPFAGGIRPEAVQENMKKEAKLIHDHYCSCSGGSNCYADRNVSFRVVGGTSEFIERSLKQVLGYFREDLNSNKRVDWGTGMIPALDHYIMSTDRSLTMRRKHLEGLEKEKRDLMNRIKTLNTSSSSKQHVKGTTVDSLAQAHGSKPAALVRFLQQVVDRGEKAIVFSYWHDTLKIVGRTLRRCGLQSVFCGGSGKEMAEALYAFTTGTVPIILLSAKSKASGANLQCASHVILLDPAGSSAEHGSTLEEQAVGRAVRMGQEGPVTVTRFCVLGTLEAELFREIDASSEKTKSRSSDSNYVIQDADKMLLKSDEPAIEENNDVKVTAAITGEERVDREFKEAEEKGDMICILDDDDPEAEGNNSSVSIIGSDSPLATTVADTNVKQEQVSKRSVSEDEESPDPKRHRTKELQNCQTAMVTPRETSKSRVEKVRRFLVDLDLEEYDKKFVESGYDSLKWLCSVSNDADVMERLSAAVGFKPGHSVRFLMGLKEEAKRMNTPESDNMVDV